MVVQKVLSFLLKVFFNALKAEERKNGGGEELKKHSECVWVSHVSSTWVTV